MSVLSQPCLRAASLAPNDQSAVLDAPASSDATIRRAKLPVSRGRLLDCLLVAVTPDMLNAAITAMASAITANIAKPSRHWPPSARAIGPEIATPALVPELTIVLVRSWRSGCTAVAIAAAMGGEASPVLEPASITAPANHNADGAVAIPTMATDATRAAMMATARAPILSVR